MTRSYKTYPVVQKQPATESEGPKFSSMILNEEIEGFQQISSHYTDDILATMEALNATKRGQVQIHMRYEMPPNEKNLRQKNAEDLSYFE